jgi:hypothetical protein
MPLTKLPTSGLDDINHRRRVREHINNIVTHQFDDSRVRTAAEVAAGVTPVNYAYPPGDTRRSSWFIYGDTSYHDLAVAPTYIDATHFSVPGDYTGTYLAQSWVLLRGVVDRNVGRVTASPVFAAGVTTVAVSMDHGGNMPTDLLAAFPQIYPNLFTSNTFETNVSGLTRHRFANRSSGATAQITLNLGIDSPTNTKGGVNFGTVGSDFVGEVIATSGCSGACAFIYTQTTGVAGFVPMPFVIAVGDLPRIAVKSPAAGYPNYPDVQFINKQESFQIISPSTTGDAFQSWYRAGGATRKGTFGFSNSADDRLILKNEEAGATAGVSIQSANGNVDMTAAGSVSLNGTSLSIALTGVPDYASDAAADAAGVPVSGVYTIGRDVRIRR